MSFGDVTVLDNARLQVRRGHVHVLIGPNGAGKTTLANVITGHLRADSGEVSLNGSPLRGAPWKRACAGIGRKFQTPRIFPRLTGQQNLELAAGTTDLSWPDTQHYDELAARQGRDLAHGLRQWLELQMVLSRRPSVVVLDEPTAGLPGPDRDAIAETITAGREHGVTYLVVEHDLDFVGKIADHVSFMATGQIVVDGTFDEVREARVVRETYLGAYA